MPPSSTAWVCSSVPVTIFPSVLRAGNCNREREREGVRKGATKMK